MARKWNSRLRSKMWPELLSKAKKYGMETVGDTVPVCYLCDEPIDVSLGPDRPGSPEVDHKIPEALGGPSILSNLFLTHAKCNGKKLDRPFEAVRREIIEGRRSSRVWF